MALFHLTLAESRRCVGKEGKGDVVSGRVVGAKLRITYYALRSLKLSDKLQIGIIYTKRLNERRVLR